MKELIESLPKPNQVLAQEILYFLYEVSNQFQENMMDSHNLALIFAPTLMLPKNEDNMAISSKSAKVVQLMIEGKIKLTFLLLTF